MSYNLSTKQKLGMIIKLNRKALNLTQNTLASKLNYVQSIVSRMEKGNETMPIDLYQTALALFNLNYMEDQSIDQQVYQLKRDIYTAFINLDDQQLDTIMTNVESLLISNLNTIIYYELLFIQLIYYYLSGDYTQAKQSIEQLKPYIPITSKEIQQLVYDITFSIDQHHPIEDLQLDNHHPGMIEYLKGLNYYRQFKTAKAIYHLNGSNDLFKQDDNVNRIAYNHYLINKLLARENDYVNILININVVLNELQPSMPIIDLLKYLKGYSLYQTKQYESALTVLETINPKNLHNEQSYYHYLVDKTKLKLNIISDFTNTSAYNELHQLFSLYQENEKNESYYSLIETFILPQIESHFDQVEFQFYTFDLLDHYWKKRFYKKYKQLITRVNYITNNQ